MKDCGGLVARQDFYFDVYTGQYVARPSKTTVIVRKAVVRIIGENRVEYNATQLDDEAFVAPRWERRHAA